MHWIYAKASVTAAKLCRAPLPQTSPRQLWEKLDFSATVVWELCAQPWCEGSVHSGAQIFPDSDTGILRTFQFMHARICSCTECTCFAQNFSSTKIEKSQKKKGKKGKKATDQISLFATSVSWCLYHHEHYSDNFRLISSSLQFILWLWRPEICSQLCLLAGTSSKPGWAWCKNISFLRLIFYSKSCVFCWKYLSISQGLIYLDLCICFWCISLLQRAALCTRAGRSELSCLILSSSSR